MIYINPKYTHKHAGPYFINTHQTIQLELSSNLEKKNQKFPKTIMLEIMSPAEGAHPSVGDKISIIFSQYCRFYGVLNYFTI